MEGAIEAAMAEGCAVVLVVEEVEVVEDRLEAFDDVWMGLVVNGSIIAKVCPLIRTTRSKAELLVVSVKLTHRFLVLID